MVNPLDWTVDTWSAIGSAATAAGLIFTGVVLRRDSVDRRRRDAEGVAAWVFDEYSKSSDELIRVTVLHVGNSGTRPVFDVRVSVGRGHVGQPTTQIGGPATSIIAVLPPGGDVARDVAHLVPDDLGPTEQLRTSVTFRDPSDRWWTRGFDGRVARERKPRPGTLVSAEGKDDEAAAFEQAGPFVMTNPIAVAAAFFNRLDLEAGDERTRELQALCRPESLSDWGDFSEIREMLDGRGLATFPEYPAPGVAYVKFPESSDQTTRASGPVLLNVLIMTLQHRPDLDPVGWRVFAVGQPIRPDQIPPPGYTSGD